jgi:hypothetical protein
MQLGISRTWALPLGELWLAAGLMRGQLCGIARLVCRDTVNELGHFAYRYLGIFIPALTQTSPRDLRRRNGPMYGQTIKSYAFWPVFFGRSLTFDTSIPPPTYTLRSVQCRHPTQFCVVSLSRLVSNDTTARADERKHVSALQGCPVSDHVVVQIPRRHRRLLQQQQQQLSE